MIKQNDVLKPVSKSGFNIVGLLGLIVLSLFLKQAGKKLFKTDNLLPKLFKSKDINEKFDNENTLNENINKAKISGIYVNLILYCVCVIIY